MKSGRLIPQIGVFAAVWLLAFSPPETLAKPIRLRAGFIFPTNSPVAATSKLANSATVSGLYLIQFTAPVQPEWRTTLAQLGVDLLAYVPDDAFVARLQNADTNAVQACPFVQWFGEFLTKYRLSPALGGQAKPLLAVAAPTEVNVLLAPRCSATELAAVQQLFGSAPQILAHRFSTVLRGAVTVAQLTALANSSEVLWLEPVPKMKLLDEVAAKIVAGDGGLQQTFCQTQGFNGTNVIVAFADSGLDKGTTNAMHPDLAGRVKKFFYYGDLTNAADQLGHGTAVASVVAGNGATKETNTDGTLYGLGVAPGAGVLVQRVFDANGNPQLPDYAKLTEDAVTNGAVIGSCSWGDPDGAYDVAAMEFDGLVRDADINAPGDQPYVLVFAAGNSGLQSYSINSPATAKNVIAVGASQNARTNFASYTNGPETLADFSSGGPCADGRIKPDLVAPGTWIASAWSSAAPPLASAPSLGTQQIDTNYAYLSGTSMAAPQVAGAAAVFVQYYRQMHTNTTPSPALVKAALINAAHALALAAGNAPTPNMQEGWGRVNVAAFFATNCTYDYLDQSVWLTNSQVWTRPVVVTNSSQPLKITLAYTDVPGSPLAVSALVNNLDLMVIAPDGHIYRGNQFDGNGVSVPDVTNTDSLNNVEGINLPAPLPGSYTVCVTASSVVADFDAATNGVPRQDFALVSSGNLQLGGTGSVAYNFPAGRSLIDGGGGGLVDARNVTTSVHSLSNLKLNLNINGQYNGDLYCYLTHGSGFSVLLNRVGRRSANAYGYGDSGMNLTFDPAATNGDVHTYRLQLKGNNNVPLGGVLTGSWQPDGRNTSPTTVLDTSPRNTSLNAFNGLDPNGPWWLFVADMSPGGTNTLVSWGLVLTGSGGAPAITQQPANQTVVCSSGNAVFTVVATNGPPLNYQWYFNAATMVGATTNVLIITNVNSGNSGFYYAVITNTSGAVTSAIVSLTVNDTTPPIVTVLGANPQNLALNGAFTDAGATANDACAGALPVITSGTVNVNVPGTYLILYVATDSSGNATTNTRTVNVVSLMPVITSFHRTTNSFVVQGHGPASYSYNLLAVTNLHSGVNWMTNWSIIANTMTDTNGLFQFTDTNVPANLRRFYRVGSP